MNARALPLVDEIPAAVAVAEACLHDECVACGEKFIGRNHHCDESRLRHVESAERRRERRRQAKATRRPGFGERLAAGAEMLGMAY